MSVKPIVDLLRSRLVEYNTIRGIVWIAFGLLEADVTDLQISQIADLMHDAAKLSEDSALRSQASLWLGITAQLVVGVLSIVSPDASKWRKSGTE